MGNGAVFLSNIKSKFGYLNYMMCCLLGIFSTFHVDQPCCRSAVVYYVGSYRRGCEFDSCTCHNRSTIGQEGKGNPHYKVHFFEYVLTFTMAHQFCLPI